MLQKTFAFLLFLSLACSGQTREQLNAAQAFVDALTVRAWDRVIALQHPQMTEKMREKEWTELWDRLVSEGGTFHAQRFQAATMSHGYAQIVHRAYFEKDSVDFRVVVDSLNLVGGFWLDRIEPSYTFPPPPYATALTFREELVKIGDSLKLDGALSIPNGPGPFAATVLVHGSGPLDRDETILGNKPFRDIAWGLAARGVMVLRYNKRTHQYPNSFDPFTITVQNEVVDDAVAAVKYLRSRPDCDTSRLSVIGHSLGAMLAPEIATLAPEVNGLAMIGLPSRNLEDVIVDQLEYIASLKTSLTLADSIALQKNRERAAQIAQEKYPDRSMFLNAPSTYYYDLHSRKLVDKTTAFKGVVLIVQGGKDYQVPMKDYGRWKELFAGRDNARFHLCEQCHHLMIETAEQASPMNYREQGHVAFEVIQELAAWCKRKW